jgi:nucleoside-diphosphate-sugar epimerase
VTKNKENPVMASTCSQPNAIRDVAHLEELLSEPTQQVVETMGRLEGDLVILGAAGKMGPSLARMALRASEEAGVSRRVVAVSRFSSRDLPSPEDRFREHGIETLRCDLLDPAQLGALPEAPNVVYMAGMKFGSTGQEALTWAMNSYLPGMVSQKYRRSRIVAFSTGNVYGLGPVHLGGSRETDPPNPVGEYAMSCLGRERIFEHFSRTLNIPMALLRLNYAAELRYGVLVDLAQSVLAGEPIDLSMGNVNVIWQADANAMALAAFDHVSSPPFVLNVAGPETLSVRRTCEELGRLLEREPVFTGVEASDALLNNGQLGHRLFGYPRVCIGQMVRWVAEWVRSGGESLGKPTHFEARDGRF